MSLTVDRYNQAIAEISKFKGHKISATDLSKILEVKPALLNAGLRRTEGTTCLEKNTDYISYKDAIGLARLHEYALRGYPTLKEVSQKIGVHVGEVAIRCWLRFDGKRVEYRIDLNKITRINPAKIEAITNAIENSRGNSRKKSKNTDDEDRAGSRLSIPKNRAGKDTPPVIYDAVNPPPISSCQEGRVIEYEGLTGIIKGYVLDDYNPQIKVHFPLADGQFKNVNLVVRAEYRKD